ncbi:MAG TPA: hypothetical protein VD815_02785 [Candidatus Saccharimonadales bacterium]|nr:hypothetical protein [Candidatus Saccharimonadales bacterium]
MLLSDRVELSSINFLQAIVDIVNYSPQRLTSIQPLKIFLCSALFFTIFYFTLTENNQSTFAHFLGSGDDTSISGTQNQTAGNYVIDLLLNPSKPVIGKDTDFLMDVKSTQGDELIELPVSFYILKDGKPVFSNPNNFALVRQGHYDFNYTFSEPGKYLLFVDIKDIFYTLDIVSVTFEIDVQEPILERIVNSLLSFITNYYYIYIPLIVIVIISYAIKVKRRKDVKQTTS